MQELLGRPLLPCEVVHHRNQDRLDNSPANLGLLQAGDHGRLHKLTKVHCPLVNLCAVCGKVFTRLARSRTPTFTTCSASCSSRLGAAIRWNHPLPLAHA